jgi:hypothetical protein
MTTDRFLFRDGYSIDEKIRRIPTPNISPETPEINRRLTELDLSEQDLKRIGKGDFFEEAEEKLDTSEYHRFVSTLFDNYGTEGDKFNMQLFVAEESISHDELSRRAEHYRGDRIDSDFDSLVEPIVLTDSNTDPDSVDMQYRTTARLEDINPDEKIPIQIINKESGQTVEHYGENYKIKAPARYRVEARVYTETSLVAVSNYSKIADGLKTDIAKTVTEMGRSGTSTGIGETSLLDLNETELLFLLQEMEGEISGLGYTIEIAGVDTADYTGQHDEDIFDTELVRAADDAGQIRKVKFYVDHPHADAGDEEDVMLRIFDDGHLTTSKPVPADLLDAIVKEIHTIRGYKEFLTPFVELIRSYAGVKFRGRSSTMLNSHVSDTNRALDNLIENYFGEQDTQTEELRLYKSMIANIGIKFCDDGVPAVENVDGVTEVDDFYEYDGKIEAFFNDYASHRLDRPDIDFDALSNHLHHLLIQDWDSPADVIEYATDQYDLSR